HHPARGHRDGHARRQHPDDGGAGQVDRHDRGPALRHPRGRPHRGRRLRRQDQQVRSGDGFQEREAGQSHAGLRSVQAAQLHHDEEQAERPRAHRDEEVLPLGPPAHPAQGDALTPDRPAAPGPGQGGDPGSAALPAPPGQPAVPERNLTLRRQVIQPVSEATPRGGADLTELVAAAKGGDREAFDAVVRATYADTYGLALRLTANEEDAKDVVQEAYLRAYRALKRFRGDASFTTWLYRITANCATTHLGKRSRHRHED